MIVPLPPTTNFVVGEDAFEDLEIRQGKQDDFYYFHNTQKTLVKYFILKKTKLTQKRCRITFIRREDGRFEPRFDFDILDVKNACPEQTELPVQENEIRRIKAKVDLSDCHIAFSELLSFLSSFEEIGRFNEALAVVSLDDKEKLSQLLGAVGKDAAVHEMVERFGDAITEKDITLLAGRRKALEQFRRMLEDADYFEAFRLHLGENTKPESAWQYFFEQNTWIFGYGLQLVSCENLSERKLEAIVVGNDLFDGAGKRTDALLKTRGRISKTLFAEIKIHTTPLLQKYPRPGVYTPSDDLMGAIAQLQKAIHKVSLKPSTNFKRIADKEGNPTGEELYFIRPKALAIVGRLSEFETPHGLNEEMLTSFELFRQQLAGVEVLTFDELYERTRFIVED